MRLIPLLFLLLSTSQDGIIVVGQENWEKPWVPDLRKPRGRVEIPADKRVDIVILGDGYLADERPRFEKDVRDWYERFLKLTPWSQLRGAFRVRGLWTPSEARATPERGSHYRLPATASGVGDVKGKETREAIFSALEKIGANRAQARGRLTHATAVVLVRNELGRDPSGMTSGVSSPDGKFAAGVAFGAYSHHEFGHAYGGLRDEYILTAGSKYTQKAPERLSIFTVSNIGTAADLKFLPWAHLSPGSAVNPDKDSLIGLLWLGGGAEEGTWHSEARCLMNGTHENWDLQKSRRGATLRDMGRFCFWCEEILVARTLEKAGLLGDSTDGEELWKKWAEECRPLYHKAFDLPGRIKGKNEENARSKLAEAKIYARPQAP